MDLSKQLSEKPQCINKVNESVFKLQCLFDDVKKLLNKPISDDNYNSAFRIFYEIFDLLPVLKNNISLPGIMRARPLKKDEILPAEQWEISYNLKNNRYIPLGKFNQKEEPLFYGSLITDEGLEHQVLSACKECCKELSCKYNPPAVQDITLSSWVISEPFSVINLCFDDQHLRYNKELKEGVDSYLHAIKDNFAPRTSVFIETFFRYFSELSRTLMAKNENYQLLGPLFIGLRY